MTPSTTQDEQSGTPTPSAEPSQPSGTVASGEPAKPADTTAAEPAKPADTTAAEPAKPADTTAATPSDQPMGSEPAKTASTLDFAQGSAESALLLETTNKSDAKKGSWIVLDDVKFDTGATTISDEAAGQLSNVAQVLEQNPDVKIEIGGFTDAPGSASKNLALSKERAESVRKALIDKGVEAKRIQAKGYGEANPVEKTDAAAEVNRRVAVRVIARPDRG